MQAALKYSEPIEKAEVIEFPTPSSHQFKTIGEVSSELGVPPYVLRFWESKFFILKPHKRKGGHRYYSPKEVEKIKQIKTLLYDEGFTIKGAKKYLRENKKMYFSKNQQNLFEDNTDITQPTQKTENNIVKPNFSTSENIEAKPQTDSVNLPPKEKLDPKVVESFINQLESVKELLNF
ncbi:MAG: MerR family transcriptional regulator [Rickettsiales bacterium]|nr:MerR family transcriptional regulator [Rickettsiales bacterium]